MEAAQIWRELAQHYFLADCFWRQLIFGGNWLHIIFQRIVLEADQIWQELAPNFFLADSFGGSSDLAGTGSTLFLCRLFWRELRFGENWLHNIFQRIVFGGSSDLAGTGITLFYSGLFLIDLEAAQILRELAQITFPGDCFGGGSDLAGTGSTLYSARLFWRQLRFGGNWPHIIFWQIVLEAAQIWRELAPHYFLADCFGGSSYLAGAGSTLFTGGLFWRQL